MSPCPRTASDQGSRPGQRGLAQPLRVQHGQGQQRQHGVASTSTAATAWSGRFSKQMAGSDSMVGRKPVREGKGHEGREGRGRGGRGRGMKEEGGGSGGLMVNEREKVREEGGGGGVGRDGEGGEGRGESERGMRGGRSKICHLLCASSWPALCIYYVKHHGLPCAYLMSITFVRACICVRARACVPESRAHAERVVRVC